MAVVRRSVPSATRIWPKSCGPCRQGGVSLDHVGPARIESYTVAHDRGAAPRAIVALRTEDDRRSWAASDEPELVGWLEGEDACGERVRVREDRSFSAAPR